MDVNDFYRLACELHGANKDEVIYREVISLSYYTCFHLINPLAQHIGLLGISQSSGMHSKLCQGLQGYGFKNNDNLSPDLNKKFYKLGLQLNAAREQRIAASYKVSDRVVNQQVAFVQLKQAERIIDLVNDIKDSLKKENKFTDFFSNA